MSENTAGPGQVHIAVADFTPGMDVILKRNDGSLPKTVYFGGITVIDRQFGGPGSSSPQWIERIVVGDNYDDMKKGTGVDVVLGKAPEQNPYCTGSSRNAQLVRVEYPDELITVEVLATEGEYALLGNKPHTIKKLVALEGKSFDEFPPTISPPPTPEARAWRTMSALCEALYLNYPHP
jgi:hypothetical protein